ncbi:hypothetical protein PAXRUDRAFT_827488 [Paxillus rubicundulus Ve08.2h10]|uniref:Uncharacterized protein n=1 Tax=Paxillus rubicundulus Ve08.2h10 TaxID=930991 RepID=A0A0D0E8I0_9AGAM|nr:hypothetical protein PAXRUDRAFT_827488 [Paxillus rubicundulus Ve08.2h10]
MGCTAAVIAMRSEKRKVFEAWIGTSRRDYGGDCEEWRRGLLIFVDEGGKGKD